MDAPPAEYRMFSSEVRILLQLDDQTISLASVGPNEIGLRNPTEIKEGNADVFVFIDGTRFQWPINFPHAIVPFDGTEISVESLGPLQLCED
jgi:hypothetical protein